MSNRMFGFASLCACFVLLQGAQACRELREVGVCPLLQRRELLQEKAALAPELAAEVQSILQEAASPYGGAQIAASIELLESYALTPIAPADLQTLQKAVAILTGTVPAAGPEKYAVAEGIAEEMGGSLFDKFAPALAPAGKDVYAALQRVTGPAYAATPVAE